MTGAAALMLSAGVALADGTSVKDGPAAVAVSRTCDGGPFAGFYMGGAIGYGSQDTTATDIYSFSGSESFDDGGFTVGIYSGYNIQCGHLVVGYESDTNWMDSDNGFGDCCNHLSSDIEWFSTARLRIGFVHSGNILFYATGGIAYAEIETGVRVDALGFSSTDDDRRFGWTAGGGVEFMRYGQWSLRAEALYMDFGDDDVFYASSTCGIGCTGQLRWEDDLWVARVGLTYRLRARESLFALPE